PAPSGAPLPSDPVFEALLTDGTTTTGRIGQLGPEDRVILVNQEQGERAIPFGQLVKLVREGEPPRSPPEGTMVLFPEGDRLRGMIGTSNETVLEVTPQVAGEAPVSIPLDSLLGLVLTPPSEPDAIQALLDRIREEKRDSDVLWMTNGDRRTGTLLELTAAKVKFQGEAGPIEPDRSAVAAIGLDPKGVSYPCPEGNFLELTLMDGSRIGVSACRVERGQVVAKARCGAMLPLGLGDLARVHVRGESIQYLSERDDGVAVYEPYLGPSRPFRRDRSVEGHPLRLAGQPYDRGLGTQSRTLLAYRLDGRARRFQALIGLDDRAGPLGSVVFRIKVDGKEAFVSPPMTVHDAPRPVDVDVSGAKLLILMTEFGERGEVRDFADWAEARLVR
ncbi:MAG: NPCBM/NEW2 domain-containing protein, partial [Isosphaeraceae bacterium]|nr:NPCBM/NEW2 domain-containing protein [Isosphaeraceae bacterium]